MYDMDTPFFASRPVSPDKFKGREDIIFEIEKFMPTVIKGNPQHFFITGDRGMGKTSLTKYLLEIFDKKYGMVGVHVLNDTLDDVNSLIIAIVGAILNKLNSESWSERIVNGFKNNIKKVGFLGTSIEFSPKKEELHNLRKYFPQFLKDLCENIGNKNGLVIVIDTINGLTETEEFANWYKSFADTMATNDYIDKCPVSFILTGYPEKLINLYNHNPSFQRIFKYHNLKELNDNEVKSFYRDVFHDIEVTYDENALNTMAHYCNGMPTVMQEIGDGVFWYLDENNHITKEILMKGILCSGEQIGVKYLQPIFDESIQSNDYLKFFEIMGEHVLKTEKETFTRGELKEILPAKETTVDNFINRAKELKIIESIIPGEYEFTNKLYPVYLLIQSLNK